MPSQLEGRSALVTGAGSGIGRAIATRLADAGAHVTVNDLSADAAEATVESIVAQGGTASASVFDITDSSAVDAGIDALVADRGALDVLVNNAGMGNAYKPGQLDHIVEVGRRRAAGEQPGSLSITVALTDAEWRRVLEVLLFGTFYCTRAALRHMEPAGRGAIVNIASTAGIMPAPVAPEYGAAKAGVIGFTRSVAHEVAGAGIRVNAVAPGTVDTPLNERFGPLRKGFATRQASGRLGRPEEIAEAVLFLASDAASFCFGEILTVSGGLA
jgi:3-oxoacyl-[acyl-carrier protein] reductase